MGFLPDTRSETFHKCGRRAALFNALVSALAGLMLLGVAGFPVPAYCADTQPVRLLIFGDSLTAGYGLPQEEAFPAQLQRALTAAGLDVDVSASSVSGDTTAGGLARLAWALGPDPSSQPDAIIVELGANDALRGFDPVVTYDNLDAILTELDRRGVYVLMAGMLAPPNLGRAYSRQFNSIFTRLADEHGVALYPFFLEGVAGNPALNQEDGMHPNARGVAEIVVRITPAVIELVRQAEQGSEGG